ncbi:MAG: hypothetical protein CHACPFDD_01855 [Phycisphaerae bacterium]|nr:hypothetical protein [Phycisphaerae bacterium]
MALVMLMIVAAAQQSVAPPRPSPAVPDRAKHALRPLDADQVQLLPGFVKDAADANTRYLRSLEPDRFLWTFRTNAGLPAPGQPYGGWEAPAVELRGHLIGHYLSACARVIAATGDAALRKNAEYTVGELEKCQAALGGGYLAAFPAEFFERVEAGGRVWAPYYTVHKIMLGLWEMYELAGSERALTVLRNLAGYFAARCDRLDDERMQAMLGNEFGGMHEVLLDLFAATGETRFFELAQRFQKRSFLAPLARGDDPLAGIHANTHLPQVAGQCRAYELTGDVACRQIAEHFWRTLWERHSFATGGSNSNEHWGPPNQLAATLSATNQEFCTSHNWENVNRYLLTWSGDARYGDMLERVFFNGILGSQHPGSGMLIYFLPLKTGFCKEYGTPTDTFTCCYGTGIQEYASLGRDVFYSSGPDLYVNLFVAARVEWSAGDARAALTQETSFPEAPETNLSVSLDRPAECTIALRIPWWATEETAVEVNGCVLAEPRAVPGSWLPIRRRWANGDRVRARFTLPLRVVCINDDPTLGAIMYGPLVLAGLVDAGAVLPGVPAPPIIGDKTNPGAWLKPVAGRPLEFRTAGMPHDLTFIPLYKVVSEHYGVYWSFGVPGGSRQQEYEAALAAVKAREARAADRIAIGDADSERLHDLQGERTESGTLNGQRWRHAVGAGFFSYRLKVDPQGANMLAVMYWGSDAGARVFDILIDGTRIASDRLEHRRPGEFFIEEYAIPPAVTQGKESVVVRFQVAPNGHFAGGVFGLWMLRKTG